MNNEWYNLLYSSLAASIVIGGLILVYYLYGVDWMEVISGFIVGFVTGGGSGGDQMPLRELLNNYSVGCSFEVTNITSTKMFMTLYDGNNVALGRSNFGSPKLVSELSAYIKPSYEEHGNMDVIFELRKEISLALARYSRANY